MDSLFLVAKNEPTPPVLTLSVQFVQIQQSARQQTLSSLVADHTSNFLGNIQIEEDQLLSLCHAAP